MGTSGSGYKVCSGEVVCPVVGPSGFHARTCRVARGTGRVSVIVEVVALFCCRCIDVAIVSVLQYSMWITCPHRAGLSLLGGE